MLSDQGRSGTPARAALGRNPALVALAVLTTLNFLNYVDRYILAAVLEPLRRDPGFAGVSDARLGLLQTSFLIVYMVFSPIGGALGDRIPRKYIVAAGVALWSLATVWSGLARGYGEMLAARALIGFGEAGYAAVAPAMISDLFSRDRRARMLSIFYTATPVGSALGFLVGGYVAKLYSWRHAFWVASAPGFLFALAALLMAEPPRGAQDAVAAADEESQPFRARAMALLRNRRWLFVTAGGALMTFSMGGLAFWMPSYFQVARGLDVGHANYVFGGISVAAGLIGTFAGGFLGDAWARRDAGAYMKISGIGLALGVPFAALAPFVASLRPAVALFFLAEVFIFLNTGPLNAALIAATSARAREVAIGMNILCIHLFGDAASPWILGALDDLLVRHGMALAEARTLALASMSAPMLVGGLVLIAGARTFRVPADHERPS